MSRSEYQVLRKHYLTIGVENIFAFCAVFYTFLSVEESLPANCTNFATLGFEFGYLGVTNGVQLVPNWPRGLEQKLQGNLRVTLQYWN